MLRRVMDGAQIGHAGECAYHQDVDQVPGGGVPHLQRQIVGCCDHRAVVAIPRYHGNLQLGHFVFQRRRVVLPVGRKCKTNLKLEEKKIKLALLSFVVNGRVE